MGVGAADGVIGPGGEPELVEKEKKKGPESPCHSWARCQLLPGGVGAGFMPRKGDE